MTAREAQSWKLYERVMGRIGKERDDYNFAQLVCTVRFIGHLIISCSGSNAGELPKTEDCLLNFQEQKNKTIEDLIEEGRQQALKFVAKQNSPFFDG